MRASLEALKRELSGLRTGRASTHLLDPIQVNVYGSKMPLNQVATISVPEPRTISVQVWDKSNVCAVDKAIREANLGINPVVDGALIRAADPDARRRSGARSSPSSRTSMPSMRASRCATCAARAWSFSRSSKRTAKMSQDEHHKASAKVQELTDKLIKEIDDTLATKETEITQGVKVWVSLRALYPDLRRNRKPAW